MNKGDYRGRGVSATKVCKHTGKPKRAGNFSYATIHRLSLQFKDYPVTMRNDELIVGDHTPLMCVMPRAVVELALTDTHFDVYIESGIVKHGGQEYEAHRRLTRNALYGRSIWSHNLFKLRLEVYTDGEFDFNFPEY